MMPVNGEMEPAPDSVHVTLWSAVNNCGLAPCTLTGPGGDIAGAREPQEFSIATTRDPIRMKS
jgi:hypothetical protein